MMIGSTQQVMGSGFFIACRNPSFVGSETRPLFEPERFFVSACVRDVSRSEQCRSSGTGFQGRAMLAVMAAIVPLLADLLTIIGFFRIGDRRVCGFTTTKRRSRRVRCHADGFEVVETDTVRRRIECD